MTLVSATETSARGGSLDLIFITLSSRGHSCDWSDETVTLPCQLKTGGSSMFGGNTAELIGDVGRTSVRRVFLFGAGPGLPPLSLGRLPVGPGAEVSNRGDSIGEVYWGDGYAAFPLPLDLCLVLLGLVSASSRGRFPRRGDSSTTFPRGGLAGVEDATGLNVSMGED
jgi:hypothetical protein